MHRGRKYMVCIFDFLRRCYQSVSIVYLCLYLLVNLSSQRRVETEVLELSSHVLLHLSSVGFVGLLRICLQKFGDDLLGHSFFLGFLCFWHFDL